MASGLFLVHRASTLFPCAAKAAVCSLSSAFYKSLYQQLGTLPIQRNGTLSVLLAQIIKLIYKLRQMLGLIHYFSLYFLFQSSPGDGNDLQFPRPRDLDLIQSTPVEFLSLKTPPRVLTLNERPLDFLEEQQQQRGTLNTDEVVSDALLSHPVPPRSLRLILFFLLLFLLQLRPQGRLRRERSASENAAARQGSQLTHSESA